MKVIASFILMLLPASGAEIEGAAWYDSSGKLVVVDGPAAKSAKKPFVPEWRKRELERRERMRSGSNRSQRSNDWNGPFIDASYGYSGGYYYSPGWSVCRPRVSRHHGGFGHHFGSIRLPRVSIIIR